MEPEVLAEPVTQLTTWSQKGMDLVIQYAPKVLMALIVLWIGSMLIGMLARLLNKVLDRREGEGGDAGQEDESGD